MATAVVANNLTVDPVDPIKSGLGEWRQILIAIEEIPGSLELTLQNLGNELEFRFGKRRIAQR